MTISTTNPEHNVSNDKVLTKIKKLLAIARDERGNENERDNAMRQVQNMLAAHNLEIADIEKHGGTTEEKREQLKDTFYGRPWARMIAHSAARLLFCEYIYRPNSDANQIVHTFIGRTSNVISAMELAKYLIDSVRKESAAQARAVFEPSGGQWARDFAKGAASMISRRVSEIIRTTTTPAAASTGTSLVLANLYTAEKKANELVLADAFPKLGKGRAGRGVSNFDAVTQGRKFGETVSLSKQISDSPSSRKRLS